IVAFRAYQDAPPIPQKVLGQSGHDVFDAEDIMAGQQVFLKYGLMENGTIWGHGAYLGPDFSAEYLHTLGTDVMLKVVRDRYGRDPETLSEVERNEVDSEVATLLKQNRYDPLKKTLTFTDAEAISYQGQIEKWTLYFSRPAGNGGLRAGYISDHQELRQLTAFFAWTAWASVANRPNRAFSYTNNFPYDPMVGNTPTPDTVLWSALSLITLLVGTALVLFAFGKFDYLGWKGTGGHVHPAMLPGTATDSQKATIKYFLIVALLFLAQVLVGGATAHFRAEPSSFYGLDLSAVFPSNILRTWHLQLAIFWIATSYVGGGLLLASNLGGKEPSGQPVFVHVLFWALVFVVGGSLIGELLGINQILGRLWFWFGHQGWEYLDLGRAWQVLLALGLVFWTFLVYRAVKPALKDPEHKEISVLFLISASTIPIFYLPAFFFGSTTGYSIVDNWRFWIIHLWVEGFFELFVTVMVAVTFYRLGMVTRQTAIRVIYLDAILFLGSGIIGTGHHWYWTGQSTFNMSLSAVFSAMEVVPLTLLTLDAWDFIKLTKGRCDVCGKDIAIPHKWTFYFLMAVGFWNFVGAGIFGFLINLPIVSYFEVGTILTPNHGHAALMGAFGMEAVALIVLASRQVLSDVQWVLPEKFIKVSFFGLNIGLMMMVVGSLFPGGVLQFHDVLVNGYWHARGLGYLNQGFARLIEWCRLPGDLVFIFLGVVPLVIAAALAYSTVNPWTRRIPLVKRMVGLEGS
ncbi:MAG TPA: nitric-oxide reductase large subunit, partial [Desulfomonilia bacterium]|nr:nitric-oxide reductase large subunit [Desulfomonilia bacterium]